MGPIWDFSPRQFGKDSYNKVIQPVFLGTPADLELTKIEHLFFLNFENYLVLYNTYNLASLEKRKFWTENERA